MNIAIVRTAAFAALIGSPALAADQKFQGELDPMPHDNSTRTIVVGSGIVTGMLSGNQLTLSGKFSGLSSPATGAIVHIFALTRRRLLLGENAHRPVHLRTCVHAGKRQGRTCDRQKFRGAVHLFFPLTHILAIQRL